MPEMTHRAIQMEFGPEQLAELMKIKKETGAKTSADVPRHALIYWAQMSNARRLAFLKKLEAKKKS